MVNVPCVNPSIVKRYCRKKNEDSHRINTGGETVFIRLSVPIINSKFLYIKTLTTMKAFSFLILTGLILSLRTSAYGQVYEIDLSNTDPGTKTVDYGKNIIVNMKNKLPFGDYRIKAIRSAIPMDPFDLPAAPATVPEIMTKGAGTGTSCTALETAYNALGAEVNEKSAKDKDLIGKLKKEINDADKKTCASEITSAENLLALTSTTIWSDVLKEGEKVEITITNTATNQSWTLILTTQPHGRWEISYGFNFITQWFFKEDLYYTKSDTQGTFVITKEHNRRTVSYSPSIMFTYMPFYKDYSGWNFGISPGLGFDMSSPAVFLCFTTTFRQNLRMHVGLAYNRQYVLMGQYAENDVISEDLSREQLHEKQYMLNPFFALSFRFKENVFDRR